MRKVLQLKGKGKVRKAKAVEVQNLQEYGVMDLDSKVALIHELIPIGLMHVKEVLQDEVITLAGEKYKRNGLPGHDRWGRQQGSIYIQDQRIPIMVQRVRDSFRDREVKLRTYEQMQEPGAAANDRLLRRVLLGLSLRRAR